MEVSNLLTELSAPSVPFSETDIVFVWLYALPKEDSMVDQVGYAPTPADFQSAASTKLASDPYIGHGINSYITYPYRYVPYRRFVSIKPYLSDNVRHLCLFNVETSNRQLAPREGIEPTP